MQVAQIALFQSTQTFDSSKANPSKDSLWAFAERRIEGSLKDELSRNTGTITAPLRIKSLSAKINRLEHAIDDDELHIKLGLNEHEVRRAVNYLKLGKSVSIDDLIINGKDGEGGHSFLDILSYSEDTSDKYSTQEFSSTLDSKEKEIVSYLFSDYSIEELPQLLRISREQIYQFKISIGKKAIDYFGLRPEIMEDITMSIKKNDTKTLTEVQYAEFKGQSIPDKEIARKYRMSTTTLRKLRNGWGVSSSAEVIVNKPDSTASNIVSLEEFNALQRAYQSLKYEYELLWRYHKQSLFRMESPYLWTE